MVDAEQKLADEERWSGWMALAQRGDGRAYSELLDELGYAIEAYIRSRFGPIDTLEDCVQECLLTIHQVRRTYDPARAFRPWLFTIVRNRTIDLLRRDSCWRRSERLARAVDGPGQAGDPGRLFDGALALEALPEQQRQVILLAKYGGFSMAEVASEIGISEGAVKACLHRGMKAIANYLRDHDS